MKLTIPVELKPFVQQCHLYEMGFHYMGIEDFSYVFKTWYTADVLIHQVMVLIHLNHDYTDAQYVLKHIANWDHTTHAVADYKEVFTTLIKWGYTPAIAALRLDRIDNVLN